MEKNNSIMMDKQLIKNCFTRAASVYDEEAVIQRQIAEKMIALIKENIPTGCRNLYEVGCGTGIFSRLLIRYIQPQLMTMNDICPDMENHLTNIVDSHHVFVSGDAETDPIPEDIDMIASCSAIQWFVNLNSFFKRCYAALNDAGWLVFSTFGKDNMREICSITGTGLHYSLKPELEKELISLNYEIIHSSEELINKSFDTPVSVLHHLKRTGVTGIRTQSWTKGTLEKFCREYVRQYSKGDSVSLTYHPIYIIAKKRKYEE